MKNLFDHIQHWHPIDAEVLAAMRCAPNGLILAWRRGKTGTPKAVELFGNLPGDEKVKVRCIGDFRIFKLGRYSDEEIGGRDTTPEEQEMVDAGEMPHDPQTGFVNIYG